MHFVSRDERLRLEEEEEMIYFFFKEGGGATIEVNNIFFFFFFYVKRETQKLFVKERKKNVRMKRRNSLNSPIPALHLHPFFSRV